MAQRYPSWFSNRALRREDVVARGFSRSGRAGLILLVLALLSGASMAHLKLTSQATTISYRIRELEERKQDLLSQKGQLLFEIAEATRLATLQQRARDQGFGPARDMEYLKVTAGVGSLSATLPSAGAATERADRSPAPDAPVPGWWARLLEQFAAWAEVESEATPTPPK